MEQPTSFLSSTCTTITYRDLYLTAEKIAHMIYEKLPEGAMATRYGVRAILPEEHWRTLDELIASVLAVLTNSHFDNMMSVLWMLTKKECSFLSN